MESLVRVLLIVLITTYVCLFCLFFIRHCQQKIQNKRKLQKNMRQNTKYYLTTKCTAGRSHPATTASRMAGTRQPKLTIHSWFLLILLLFLFSSKLLSQISVQENAEPMVTTSSQEIKIFQKIICLGVWLNSFSSCSLVPSTLYQVLR